MKNNTLQVNIPKEWKEKKLGDICDFINGKTPLRSKKEYWDDDDIPWFTIEDVRNQGRVINKTKQFITQKALSETGIKIVPKNSVLLCCTASVGEYALTKIDITTNQQFNGLIIKNKDKIIPEFLFAIAPTFKKKLKKISGTTTFGFVNLTQLNLIKINLPTLSEQAKIAEILSKVDEEIEKVGEVIGKAEELKIGFMQEFFSGKLKVQSEKWEVKKLVDVATLQRGFDLPAKNRVKGKYPLASSNGITDTHNEFKVKGPGIFTGRSGTIGNVFYVNEDYWPLNTTLYVKDFHGNNEKFIYYFLQKFNLKKYHSGTGVPTLNRNIVHDEKVAIPKSIQEQTKIANILSTVDDKILINKKIKDKLTELKKGLMGDLLSGRVRV